ncbi:putative N-acetylmannosamine-6-phosphate 2-epimerase [Ktedonosporobacter rubrisoli]|uniref:N-acylglucosamine-6-phosphate 2-epimerase n=1 Tax=Ktedonosporobacter rubrisoli TaxID=2509675 RepID=A0A4P6JQW2_KTERU|nr:putative N-acetylmannosamine-6-phosphate 2-epimerase [Ktedonosporobacter rubrisoli]QBD77827.1 putative N-acetylmannosamine-6-phosphate 2-epimerase [Ktedonosporobacter rubrisoli]
MMKLELPRGLVVSCQAHGDNPLRGAETMAAMAVAAERAGAIAIRADGPDDIRAIARRVQLPLIGIYKVDQPAKRAWITPTFEHAHALVEAGASIVALDASYDYQPDDGNLTTLITRIHEELKVPVFADISTFAEAQRAWKLGAEAVLSTLSGYTSQSPARTTPDGELVARCAKAGMCVIAEGHVRSPEQASMLLSRGAYAVVVGTAITNPLAIASWYREAMQDVLQN